MACTQARRTCPRAEVRAATFLNSARVRASSCRSRFFLCERVVHPACFEA